MCIKEAVVDEDDNTFTTLSLMDGICRSLGKQSRWRFVGFRPTEINT